MELLPYCMFYVDSLKKNANPSLQFLDSSYGFVFLPGSFFQIKEYFYFFLIFQKVLLKFIQ